MKTIWIVCPNPQTLSGLLSFACPQPMKIQTSNWEMAADSFNELQNDSHQFFLLPSLQSTPMEKSRIHQAETLLEKHLALQRTVIFFEDALLPFRNFFSDFFSDIHQSQLTNVNLQVRDPALAARLGHSIAIHQTAAITTMQTFDRPFQSYLSLASPDQEKPLCFLTGAKGGWVMTCGLAIPALPENVRSILAGFLINSALLVEAARQAKAHFKTIHADPLAFLPILLTDSETQIEYEAILEENLSPSVYLENPDGVDLHISIQNERQTLTVNERFNRKTFSWSVLQKSGNLKIRIEKTDSDSQTTALFLLAVAQGISPIKDYRPAAARQNKPSSALFPAFKSTAGSFLKICPHCQTINAADASSCRQCGANPDNPSLSKSG